MRQKKIIIINKINEKEEKMMKTEVETKKCIVIDIEVTSARYEPGGGDRGGRSIPVWKEMLV